MTLTNKDFLDAARKEAERAESYAQIVLEAERLQNASQGLSGRDAIQQALTNIYGDNAQQKAEEIARDADRKHSYDAGEHIRKAWELYEDALKKSVQFHISVLPRLDMSR